MKEEDAVNPKPNPNPNPIVSNRKKGMPAHLRPISLTLGGIMTVSCLQPIDVIRTRLQLDRTRNYRGIIHCGATISRTEGVRALWKGLTPHAARFTFKLAFRIGSNAAIQSAFLDSQTGKFTHFWPLLGAFGAGILFETLVIVTPLEVVKIRLQQQRGLNPAVLKYKGALQCAGMIIREEGLRGLFAGAAPTFVRNGVHQVAIGIARNALNEIQRKRHEGNQRERNQRKALNLMFGTLAVASAPVCSNPFDVVKTRLMAQSGRVKYKGMMHAMRTIYAEEGLRAFWRGTLPNLMWTPLSLFITTAVLYRVEHLYETSKNINVQWKPK